ncbi:MAG: hypothetical protein JXB17_02520 [Bacteroidales bacterium]|nr:hypothetical protein [Bacteroidales bacterium]
MKTFLLTNLLMFCYVLTSIAQIPQVFNYQAVVRDNNSNPLTDQQVEILVSILKTTENGNSVYTESFTKITNEFGLINLEIGKGNVESGNFNTIDWAVDKYYLMVEIEANGNSIISKSQLLSVPYALYAENTNNVDDADADPANEIQNLSNTKSGSNVTVNISNGSGTTFNIDDADADPANEIQIISISNDTIYLTNGGYAKLPASSGGDNDSDSTNELQIITKVGNTVTLSDGGGSFTDEVNNADTSSTNEIQALSISNDTLFLENGGNVKLPGLILPYSSVIESDSYAINITNNGQSGGGIYSTSNTDGHAVWGQSNGEGTAIGGRVNNGGGTAIYGNIDYYGTGKAGYFSVDNPNNTEDAVYGKHVGGGNGGFFWIDNPSYSDNAAVYALSGGAGNAIYAKATSTNNSAGYFEIAHVANSMDALYVTTNGTGRAAYFDGDVHVQGNLSKSSGSFTIDHPLDPENEILNHSFVESPEMINIYKGRTKLENGIITIPLPAYFDSLNHPVGREITLTPVNGWSPLYLEGEINNNQFTIKTTDQGNPNQEFSWVIYAVRNDKFARENPIIVEQEKGEGNRFKKGELLYETK